MKHLFYLLICLFIYNISDAQTDTTDWIYELDEAQKINLFPNQYRRLLLKIDNQYLVTPDIFLGEMLRHNIENESILIYKDKELRKPYLADELENVLYEKTVDTVIFYTENFNTEIKIFHSILQTIPNQTAYQLHQHWYFDDKTHQLKTNIKQFSAVNILDKDTIPLFHFDNKPSGNKVHKNGINYSVLIGYRGNFNAALTDKLLSKSHLKNQITVIKKYDMSTRFDNFFEPIKFKQLKKEHLERIDTVYRVNRETLEDVMFFEKFGDDIKDFYILQEIFFNNSTKTLESKIVAIAPMEKSIPTTSRDGFHYNMGNAIPFYIIYDENLLNLSPNDFIFLWRF